MLFIAVAQAGGLSGAQASTGFSPATLGRRMVALEQQLGRILFDRSQSGYALTIDGHALLDHLKSFEAAQRGLDVWRQRASAPALVRMTLGTWIA
ncbi:DNA-binding transcriptional LysR family regulator [Agrobacterium vitis]|nr:DNA-binding transcriptional LysR family regulator [Agrobacterium vitis]MBE1438229.1 DNA-binding transcriptional LysR family regulator [Agrobacterium vitis]